MSNLKTYILGLIETDAEIKEGNLRYAKQQQRKPQTPLNKDFWNNRVSELTIELARIKEYQILIEKYNNHE